MTRRAKTTLRKGSLAVINNQFPAAAGTEWGGPGDQVSILGRHRPDCWPYDEQYLCLVKRTGVIGTVNRLYLDKLNKEG